MGEQRLNIAPQAFVAIALRCDERVAFSGIAIERSVADLLDPTAAISLRHSLPLLMTDVMRRFPPRVVGNHAPSRARLGPATSRASQIFVSRQSRLTVSCDTCSTSAVSSTL